MVMDPLDKDERQNGVDRIVDGEHSKMGWEEGFTQGLTFCAKEYGDWMIVVVSECPG